MIMSVFGEFCCKRNSWREIWGLGRFFFKGRKVLLGFVFVFLIEIVEKINRIWDKKERIVRIILLSRRKGLIFCKSIDILYVVMGIFGKGRWVDI